MMKKVLVILNDDWNDDKNEILLMIMWKLININEMTIQWRYNEDD